MTARHTRVPLVAFGLLTVADLGCLAVGYDTGHTLAKPLLMPLLAVHARACGGPRLLVVALLFGWGGDVLLLFDAEQAFLAGMASFAAGHVCYLRLFMRHRGKSASRARGPGGRFTAAAYAVALVATVSLLWPGLPADLRVPVAGYSLLLTAMAYGAMRLGPVAGVGGALFMLSDTLIATGVAEWPQLPRPDLWIMLTYIAAQYLLARGVTSAPGERPVPSAGPVTSGSAPATP